VSSESEFKFFGPTLGSRLNAVFHPSSGTDWFRRQSGISRVRTNRQEADIGPRFFKMRVASSITGVAGTLIGEVFGFGWAHLALSNGLLDRGKSILKGFGAEVQR
jgi:hypothetical protein